METEIPSVPTHSTSSLSLKADRGEEGAAELISSSATQFVFPLCFHPVSGSSGNHLESLALIYLRPLAL